MKKPDPAHDQPAEMSRSRRLETIAAVVVLVLVDAGGILAGLLVAGNLTFHGEFPKTLWAWSAAAPIGMVAISGLLILPLTAMFHRKAIVGKLVTLMLIASLVGVSTVEGGVSTTQMLVQRHEYVSQLENNLAAAESTRDEWRQGLEAQQNQDRAKRDELRGNLSQYDDAIRAIQSRLEAAGSVYRANIANVAAACGGKAACQRNESRAEKTNYEKQVQTINGALAAAQRERAQAVASNDRLVESDANQAKSQQAAGRELEAAVNRARHDLEAAISQDVMRGMAARLFGVRPRDLTPPQLGRVEAGFAAIIAIVISCVPALGGLVIFGRERGEARRERRQEAPAQTLSDAEADHLLGLLGGLSENGGSADKSAPPPAALPEIASPPAAPDEQPVKAAIDLAPDIHRAVASVPAAPATGDGISNKRPVTELAPGELGDPAPPLVPEPVNDTARTLRRRKRKSAAARKINGAAKSRSPSETHQFMARGEARLKHQGEQS